MATAVDWATAERVASRIARRGAPDLPSGYASVHRDFEELTAQAQTLVEAHTGWTSEAGLARARGDYMVTIDADLQDPPEVIAEMLQTARRDGVDVVYGVRSDRSTDSVFKRTTARMFYSLIRRISGTTAQSDAGDFRLMSRATVDAVNSLPDTNRVLRFVVPALGFPSTSVAYRREERAAGTSKYPFLTMLKLSVDSVTGFSLFPLRLATYLGLIGGALMLVAAIVLVIASRTPGTTIPGWTSTVVIVAGVGAVQLFCLGLLGEYVGRMYTQLQGRPAYFIASDSLIDSLVD